MFSSSARFVSPSARVFVPQKISDSSGLVTFLVRQTLKFDGFVQAVGGCSHLQFVVVHSSVIWHDVLLLFQPESFLKAPWPPPLIMVSFRVCFIGSLPPTTIYLSKPRRVCYTKELWSMMSSATAIIKMYLSMDEDYIVRGLHVEMLIYIYYEWC